MPNTTTEPCPRVQLTGTDGNAFALLATARRAMRAAGCSPTHIDKVWEEATSGDYNHLLATLAKYCEVS